MDKIKQASNIGIVHVNDSNLLEISRCVKNMIHNDEDMARNLVMCSGNKVIWNPKI